MKMKKRYVIMLAVAIGITWLLYDWINPTWNYIMPGEIITNNKTSIVFQTMSWKNSGQLEEYSIKKDRDIIIYNREGNMIDFAQLSEGDSIEIIYTNRRNRITGKNKYDYSGNREFLRNVVEIKEIE